MLKSMGWICLLALCLTGCNPSDRDPFTCTSDSQCDADEICSGGECVQVECKLDGDCPSGERCVEHACVTQAICRSDEDCEEPTPVCNLDTGECVTCVPRCAGVCCGDDGCGGTCEDRCTDTGQVCNPTSCECEGECIPACAGKNCGQDGCGSTCPPGCDVDEICVQGVCEAVGCTSDDDCQAPTPRCNTNTGDCVECLVDGDCAAGLTCSGGICAQESKCEVDDQCDIRQICENGECVDGCRSDRDCPSGETCDEQLGPHGTCVECEQPAECPEGTTCEDHRCVPHCTLDSHCTPLVCDVSTNQCVECLQDAHCGDDSGLICSGHVCVEGCRQDEDCPSGHCNADTNLCVDCVTKDDCPLGNLCIDEQCVTGCESARDCPGDLQCNPAMGEHGACVECLTNTDCDPGTICSQGLCVFHCSTDADCDPPDPACDVASGTCVPCVGNEHCALGTICVDLACLPGCELDRDCPSGQVCDPNLGSHGGCVDCRVGGDCPQGYICENNHCVLEGSDMVRLPGGDFVRGSDPDDAMAEADEIPETVITVPTFYIDRTEVTNDQYRACVQAGACTAPQDTTAYNHPQKGNHPVVHVTRSQAADFCYWMGKGLPTEARWERAARGLAPDERAYPWGNGAPDCSRANYSGCQGDTSPVGSHPQGATADGILDMAGNVYEWVYDYYADDYYETSYDTVDPFGPLDGEYRVTRGGGFDSPQEKIRCANRAAELPDDALPDVGFRCALVGAPVADISVTPDWGDYQDTHFLVDASASTDPNHAVASLEVRWDWEDDDTYDTVWTTAKSASHRYAYPGIFRIRLEVRDPDGNSDTAWTDVVAEGTEGWDGTACETDQDCAHGFACIFELATFAHVCREDCGLLSTGCHIEGQSCNIWIDLVGGSLGFACQWPT